MLSLPFDKWKLNFYERDLEIQYEEHSNKIRLIAFKLLNLVTIFDAIITLLIFVIQQQPNIIIIIMAAITLASFGFYLLSSKLQPHLKVVFSALYILCASFHFLIALNGKNIPSYFFGVNSSAIFLGIIQFGDNRLKIVYTIGTPLVMMFVFSLFTLDGFQFIFHSCVATSFFSVLTYMYEYTSRLAFSLNLIANLQQDLINEFVTNSLFAISLDERTRQFNLEFLNKTFKDLLNIDDSGQIRQFLRESFVIDTINGSQRLKDKSLQKLQSLEEYCFKKIRTIDSYMNFENQDHELDIVQQDKNNSNLIKMKINFKKLNFGKPILVIIIKKEQILPLIESYENEIMDYQQLIVLYSQQILNSSSNINQEIKKIKQHFPKNIYDQQFLRLQCLNLQIINFVRNYYIYFQQDKIQQIAQFQNITNLNEYFETIQQYFYNITEFYSVRFNMNYQIESQVSFNINIKFLTQISINLFQLILQHTMKDQSISLIIAEEQQLQQTRYSNQQSYIKMKIEQSQTQSKQLNDLRQISFTFTFYSEHQINFQQLQSFQIENQRSLKNLNHISDYVTCYLLDQIGPNNFVHISQAELLNSIQRIYYQYRLKFLVYSDQSQIEPSFIKQIKAVQKKS